MIRNPRGYNGVLVVVLVDHTEGVCGQSDLF